MFFASLQCGISLSESKYGKLQWFNTNYSISITFKSSHVALLYCEGLYMFQQDINFRSSSTLFSIICMVYLVFKIFNFNLIGRRSDLGYFTILNSPSRDGLACNRSRGIALNLLWYTVQLSKGKKEVYIRSWKGSHGLVFKLLEDAVVIILHKEFTVKVISLHTKK